MFHHFKDEFICVVDMRLSSQRKKERAKRKREEIKGKKCLVSTDRENVHWKEGVMIKKIIIHPTYVSTM